MTTQGQPPETRGGGQTTGAMSVLTRDEWIFGGVTLLLVIDLLFLPWFSITVGPFSASLSATDAPDGWLAVLAVIAAAAAIADLGIERFSPQTRVPALRNSRTETRFALVCLAAALVFLKFVLHIHFSLFGFGFWLGIVLTAGMVFLALRARGT